MNVSQSGLDRRLLQHAKSSWWRRLQPNQGLRNATVSFQNGPHHPISCKDPTRIQQGHVSEPKWEFREEWRKLKISQKIWDRMPEETQVCSLVRSLVQYVVIRCHEYATSDMLWTRLCPPQVHILKLSSQMWRYLEMKPLGGNLIDLRKNLRELVLSLCPMRIQQEADICKPGRFTRHWICWFNAWCTTEK